MKYPLLLNTRIVKLHAESIIEPEKAPSGTVIVSNTSQGALTSLDKHAICDTSIIVKGQHTQNETGDGDTQDVFFIECIVQGLYQIPESMPSANGKLSVDDVNILASYIIPIAASTVSNLIFQIGYGKAHISPSAIGEIVED